MKKAYLMDLRPTLHSTQIYSVKEKISLSQ
nr:MAG TPA: hypothetical protein [Caudoviricetes sp.]